jgi:hypothetical protein
VAGWIGIAVLGAEQPPVLGGTKPVHVLAQQVDHLRRYRHIAHGHPRARLIAGTGQS